MMSPCALTHLPGDRLDVIALVICNVKAILQPVTYAQHMLQVRSPRGAVDGRS
jgi:hypothetical protein